MTVIVPTHNEQATIRSKMTDLQAQNYPAEKLDVIVADDGSTDETAAIAQDVGVKVLRSGARVGKRDALNRALEAATGQLVCFTDATNRLSPGALGTLAAAFDDPRVAVVSGSNRIAGPGVHGAGEGLYWRLESGLKTAESQLGCTMGADGGLLAARRERVRPIPTGVLSDDLFVALDALARGDLVRYVPDACAVAGAAASLGAEFERRTRVAAGTWQGVLTHLRLADPRDPWLALAFVSHRLLRSIIVPLLLPVAWAASAVSARRSCLGKALFLAQSVTYLAAATAAAADIEILAAPFEFALANIATLRGGWRYLRGRQANTWTRAGRVDL